MGTRVYWRPNSLATRAEVFAFAKNILNIKNGTDGYCVIDGLKVKEPCKVWSDLAGEIIQY